MQLHDVSGLVTAVDNDAYARMGLATTPVPTISSSPADIPKSSEPAAPEQMSAAAPSASPALGTTEPHAPSLLSQAASSPPHDPVQDAFNGSNGQPSSSGSGNYGSDVKAKTVRRSVSELPAAGQKLAEKASPPDDGRPSSAHAVPPPDLKSSQSQQQHPDGAAVHIACWLLVQHWL